MSAVTGPRVAVVQQWSGFVSMKDTAGEFSRGPRNLSYRVAVGPILSKLLPNGRWREFASTIMKGNSTVFGAEARTVALRASVGSTNVASLSGNHYCLYVYVENHGHFLKVRTIEQKRINAKSARFKAECNL
jgi:hypothetical protein